MKISKKIASTGLLLLLIGPMLAQAQEVRTITFPVQGENSFSTSFGEPRSGGRTHEGVDIFAKKMTPLISAVDGYVSSLPQNEPVWGYAIVIRDSDGYSYHYLHVNNDTPGTDDDMGGTVYAYAPTITRGAPVQAGQLVGWVGDSGNAETTTPHLHFEIRTPDGIAIDPYLSLINASQPGAFNPEAVRLSVASIDIDKGLVAGSASACLSGQLIKSNISATVYYCGADGKRYFFPSLGVYSSWYENFNDVVKVSPEDLALHPLGGNVTYKPGTKMVKIQTDPKVYAVDRGGMLRWVQSENIAKSMYGTGWAKAVDDVSVALFVNYTIGEPITAPLQ